MTSIGLRVKSGYAIVIALAGPASSPTALMRSILELSDPKNDRTRQPYHEGLGTAQPDGEVIARLVKIIERNANRTIGALLHRDPLAASACRRAGLVVGSVIDPAKVGNPHIRAHASEGRLFRTVVEEGLRAHGVSSMVFVDKQLMAHAVGKLKRSETNITRAVAAFGKTVAVPGAPRRRPRHWPPG
jgi:hypothetical protein